MWYDDNGKPWLDKNTWNETKGDYCREHGIHLHFDDTDVYNETFTTPFARVWSKNGRGNKPKHSTIK